MAGVDITVSGVLYDKLNRTIQQVVLIGEASLTGLGVGGGPIYPPQQPPSGGRPPHPEHPIWGPPGSNFPDKPGYPPTAEHPIVIPPPPTEPPDTGNGGDAGSIVKPPPPEGGWAWSPEYGWGYFPGTSSPGPKG